MLTVGFFKKTIKISKIYIHQLIVCNGGDYTSIHIYKIHVHMLEFRSQWLFRMQVQCCYLWVYGLSDPIMRFVSPWVGAFNARSILTTHFTIIPRSVMEPRMMMSLARIRALSKLHAHVNTGTTCDITPTTVNFFEKMLVHPSKLFTTQIAQTTR